MENHEQNFLVTTTRNINLPLFNKFHPKLYLFKVFNHFIHATEHARTPHTRHIEDGVHEAADAATACRQYNRYGTM